MAEDVSAWTNEARRALIETAKVYHATITYGELADRIQDRTGVHTKQLLQNWIGEPLANVSDQCAENGEPLLSSLCVSKVDGTVGKGYPDAVARAYGVRPDDLELHAAEERLKCYQYFNAVDLPEDGGTPALTAQVESARRTVRERDQTQRRSWDVSRTCPECHKLPSVSGVCACD